MTCILQAINKQFYNFNFPLEFFPRTHLENLSSDALTINVWVQSSTEITNIISSIAFNQAEVSEDKHTLTLNAVKDTNLTKALQINFQTSSIGVP